MSAIQRDTTARCQQIAWVALDGPEREEQVNTGIATATTSLVATAVEAPEVSQHATIEMEERTEESFEATIVRLDGPSAERLFQQAGLLL